MKIGNRKIGTGERCFIIAEAGVNHNGSVERALEMIRVAVDAGADAVKFQTFNAELIVTQDADKAEYQKENTGNDESQFQMLKELELPLDAYATLIAECEKNNIIFMSTPFDIDSVDFLDKSGMGIYKIPSGEITHLSLIAYIAEKMKPIILSTGMSTIKEVGDAVNAVLKTGNKNLTLLQCTSNYPVDPRDVNLRAMQLLEKQFNVPVGFSDHTLGVEIAMAAVALGASVIEKHFTLDKSLPGPDHIMSLTPEELTEMVSGIKKVEDALGDGEKKRMKCEDATAEVARKSIHYSRDISAGSIVDENDFIMLRPGNGISPAKLADFIGKELLKEVKLGTKLHPDDF